MKASPLSSFFLRCARAGKARLDLSLYPPTEWYSIELPLEMPEKVRRKWERQKEKKRQRLGPRQEELLDPHVLMMVVGTLPSLDAFKV